MIHFDEQHNSENQIVPLFQYKEMKFNADQCIESKRSHTYKM